MRRAHDLADAHADAWPSERNTECAAAFERAAVAALRAPVIAERSIVLRKVAKVVVPNALRPFARRAVARFDRASRAAFDVLRSRR